MGVPCSQEDFSNKDEPRPDGCSENQPRRHRLSFNSDSIDIFNKFEALEGFDAKLVTRSAFSYEDEDHSFEATSKSDGEIQNSKKHRRWKIPPSTMLTRSAAKNGTLNASLQ